MHSLRSRLILSHVLPVLITVPLLALIAYALLTSQGMLTSVEDTLSAETARLQNQANLLAEISGNLKDVWSDPTQAQNFVASLNLNLSSVTLLDREGRVLAASEGVFTNLEQQLEQDNIAAILSGRSTLEFQLRTADGAQTVADVLVPVFDVDQRLTGVLLLSQEVADVQARMRTLTWLLPVLFVLMLLAGVVMGVYLALRLNRAITRVTGALQDIAVGAPPPTLPETDVAEIDTLYRAVNTLVARLTALEDARRRMLANLVHELGRPLGSLQAAVQALRQGAVNAPPLRDELLAGMDDQLTRMQPLLDDLTELHGHVLGTLTLNRQPTPLRPWLMQTTSLWRLAAEQKGLRWRVDIPLDLPTAALDQDQMARALGNLISNAIKYTPQGGVIEVHAGFTRGRNGDNAPDETQAATWWVRVDDTGPGVPTAEQAAIFEPFRRGEMQRRFPQGMGLGLSIARDIVDAHEGTVTVASAPGDGSSFTVTVPLV